MSLLEMFSFLFSLTDICMYLLVYYEIMLKDGMWGFFGLKGKIDNYPLLSFSYV